MQQSIHNTLMSDITHPPIQNIQTRSVNGDIGISTAQVFVKEGIAMVRGTFSKADLLELIAILDGTQRYHSLLHNVSDKWSY